MASACTTCCHGRHTWSSLSKVVAMMLPSASYKKLWPVSPTCMACRRCTNDPMETSTLFTPIMAPWASNSGSVAVSPGDSVVRKWRTTALYVGNGVCLACEIQGKRPMVVRG